MPCQYFELGCTENVSFVFIILYVHIITSVDMESDRYPLLNENAGYFSFNVKRDKSVVPSRG